MEPSWLPAVCTSSNCKRCLIDSTGVTSGMDNFAICWSMADGGGVNGVVMAAGGFGKEGAGVRLVDLSPSINFFTVSDILG